MDLTLLFSADTIEDHMSISSTVWVLMAGSVCYYICHLSFWHLPNGQLQADKLAMRSMTSNRNCIKAVTGVSCTVSKHQVQATYIFCLFAQTWEAKSGNRVAFTLSQVMLVMAQKMYTSISCIMIFGRWIHPNFLLPTYI